MQSGLDVPILLRQLISGPVVLKLILHQTILRKKALKNNEGKGENAGNQHFLLFPQCFLSYKSEKSFFQHIVASAVILVLSKILWLVKSMYMDTGYVL